MGRRLNQKGMWETTPLWILAAICVVAAVIVFLPKRSGEPVPEEPPVPAAVPAAVYASAPEKKEWHNPYDDAPYTVCGQEKYIQWACRAYIVADTKSDVLKKYQTGDMVFIASYNTELGWSRIQEGDQFYFVESKYIVDEDPMPTVQHPIPQQ